MNLEVQIKLLSVLFINYINTNLEQKFNSGI